VARDRWEDKKLQPRIDALKETEGTTVAEKQRALILLSTFMVAAGLLTGEAFFGTESSILSFIDSLWYNDDGTGATVMGVENFPDSSAWYAIRMAGLILINVAVGAAIYYLFKRAGVIGGDATSTKA
jgi:hypothetical protein